MATLLVNSRHHKNLTPPRSLGTPIAAIEETLVNAMYHRGYDQREPVEVRVNPTSIQIVSYPGPDPSIHAADLKKKNFVARRYRNRRIGEFFKELEMTEGRSTGVPKTYRAMSRNGSPRPKFETDELRLWFIAELPIHRAFREEAAAQVTPQVTPQVISILIAAENPCARDELQAVAGIKDREHFRKTYLLPLLETGWLERTIPDKPNSRLQKYRLTAAGRDVLESQGRDRQNITTNSPRPTRRKT